MAVRMTGRILRINVDRHDVLITLDNEPAVGPKDNQFILREDHANKNAVYSLALAAAANRWPVTIRIEGDTAQIDPAAEAGVHLLAVSWAAAGADDD